VVTPAEFVKAAEEFLEKVKIALTLRAPFLLPLFRRIPVAVCPQLRTMAVTDTGILLIGLEILYKSFGELFEDVNHELVHVILGHHIRGKTKKHEGVWNVAADCPDNEFLKACGFRVKNAVTAETISRLLKEGGIDIPPDEIRKYSAETIYRLLLRAGYPKKGMPCAKPVGVPIPIGAPEKGGGARQCPGAGQHVSVTIEPGQIPCTLEDALTEKPKSGQPVHLDLWFVQGGDPKFWEAMNERDERERFKKFQEWARRAMDEVMAFARRAGTGPLGALRMLMELVLKPKLSWADKLAGLVSHHFGSMRTVNPYKPHRRYPHFPAYRRRGIKVWALVDTSGSIGEKELLQALSEIYGIASECGGTIIVVPWDADVYEAMEVTDPEQVAFEVAKKMKGGGGTVIKPVLKWLVERLGETDLVVIFTDGFIFDLDDKPDPETVSLLKRILGTCTNSPVFVTWEKKPKALPNGFVVYHVGVNVPESPEALVPA